MKKEKAISAARYSVFKSLQLTSAGLSFVFEKTANAFNKADTYFLSKCAFAKRDYQKEVASDELQS